MPNAAKAVNMSILMPDPTSLTPSPRDPTSRVPSAFYPNVEFVAEHGGTLVP